MVASGIPRLKKDWLLRTHVALYPLPLLCPDLSMYHAHITKCRRMSNNIHIIRAI